MKAIKMDNGTYKVEVYVGKGSDGKRIRKTFRGSDKKKVMRDATTFLDEHRNIPGRQSLESAIGEYIESRTPVLSPSTIRGYKIMEKSVKRAVPSLYSSNIYSISSADVQKMVNILTDTQTPKTLRNECGFISAVLKSHEISMPFVRLPESVRPALNIPDEVTMKRIFKLSKGDPLEIPILLAATGPLRRGEICALSLDDIDGNIIHVSKDKVVNSDGKYEIRPPKNLSSDRYVEMSQKVIDLINKQGYVTDLDPHNITDRFRLFLWKYDIPAFRFHDLRHYCVSMLKAHNIPDIYIQQRGGWTTDNIMKSVYTHTLQNQSRKQTDVMIDLFDRMIE